MTSTLPSFNNVSNFRRGLMAIRRIIANPCDTPFVVYIELAAAPTGRAVLTLLAFDMADLLRSYFRPKSIRSGRHMGRGRKGRRRGFGFPEPSDVVAKRIPGHEASINRHVAAGPRLLWEFDGRVQGILFHYMLADVVGTWIYETGSAILTNEAKNCLNRAASYQTGPGQWVPVGTTAPIPLDTVVYDRGIGVAPNTTVSVGPGIWQFACTNKIFCTGTLDGRLEGRIGVRVTKGGRTRLDWQGWRSCRAFETLSFAMSTTTNGPAEVQFLMQFRGGFGVGEESTFLVVGF